jgi:hypothetical protein
LSERSEDAPALPPDSPPADESPFPLPPLDPQERGLDLTERRLVASEEMLHGKVDPEASPFALQPIEGLPFDRDSYEAVAIRKVIEEADRERARGSWPSSAV